MAFKCDNCGKSIKWGHRVSHAKNRTNYAFKPNIQKKKIVVDGRSIRVKLCTNCIKTLRKVKKVKAPKEAPASQISLQA
jgi:large subunit ribosomal protein L28